MSVLAGVENELGLVVLTGIVSGLTAYLVHTMLHPERV
jgi:hypothetical protein